MITKIPLKSCFSTHGEFYCMDHFVFTKSQVSLQNTARLTAAKLLYQVLW